MPGTFSNRGHHREHLFLNEHHLYIFDIKDAVGRATIIGGKEGSFTECMN